jgi:hypothetical protein
MFKRRVEVRLAKDAPVVEMPQLDEEQIKRLINYVVQAYTTIKMVNLACSISQHVVVRTLP